MSTTIRAARCHQAGGPDDVVVERIPAPVASDGEVVVDIAHAAVNFPDVLIMSGDYQVQSAFPITPGAELAGIVRTVGPGVTALQPGDRVYGSVGTGAFAEQAATTVERLHKVPNAVNLATAAGFHVTYSTAYHALRTAAPVQPGEWVLVLGAAGGVGLATVDVALALGAKVVAVASTATKRDACLKRGAHAAFDNHDPDLKSRLRDVSAGGIDVVIDPVGGYLSEIAIRSCRWGARFVTVGYASGTIPAIPLNLLLLKGVTANGLDVRTLARHQPADVARDQAELGSLLARGDLTPMISARFPLDAAAAALRHVSERRAIGKVLIDINPRIQ